MRAHAARSDKIKNEGPSLKNFIATKIPKKCGGRAFPRRAKERSLARHRRKYISRLRIIV
jgi:hypothetical protein